MRYKAFFLGNFCFGIVIYLLLISQSLVNTYDGMWKTAMYTEFDWVISIGRWFWPVISMLRLDLSPEPFVSLLSLGLFAMGNCLIISMFELLGTRRSWLAGFSLICNTAVCVALSYSYMSPTFANAYLLNVFAAWALCKIPNKMAGWIAATVSVVLSLGLYQAYLGCFCLLIAVLTMRMLAQEKDGKTILLFLAWAAASFLVGCILYKLIWDLVLRFNHIEASGYNGANQLSVSDIFTHLPQRMTRIYQIFRQYFLNNIIKHNAFQNAGAFYILLSLYAIAICLLALKAFRIAWYRAVIIIGIAALLPAVLNISLLIATQADIIIQMTLPMAMLFPVLFCLIESRSLPGWATRWVPAVCAVAMAFILYGNVIMVSTDQYVLQQSTKTTRLLFNRVMTVVESREMIHPETNVIFLGNPSSSPLYRKNALWDQSNDYARFGQFWLSGNCNTQSYYGLLRDCGIEMPFCWDDGYIHELETYDQFINMPVYPENGFVCEYNGAIIIKLSNY